MSGHVSAAVGARLNTPQSARGSRSRTVCNSSVTPSFCGQPRAKVHIPTAVGTISADRIGVSFGPGTCPYWNYP